MYACNWYLSVGESEKRLQKHCDRVFPDEGKMINRERGNYARTYTISRKSGYLDICGEYDHTIPQMAVLSHECNHMALFVLLDIGFIVTDDHNQEPLCYLQQYYLQESLLLLYHHYENAD